MTPEEVTPRVKPVIECEPAEMTGLKVVGTRVPKADAVDKVLGKAEYIYDMQLPGMLYAKIKYSERAHAKIVSIDTAAGREGPRRQSRHHRLQHAAHPHGLHEGQLRAQAGHRPSVPGRGGRRGRHLAGSGRRGHQADQGGLRGSARLLLSGGVPGGRRHAHPRDRPARQPQPQQQDPAASLEVPGGRPGRRRSRGRVRHRRRLRGRLGGPLLPGHLRLRGGLRPLRQPDHLRHHPDPVAGQGRLPGSAEGHGRQGPRARGHPHHRRRFRQQAGHLRLRVHRHPARASHPPAGADGLRPGRGVLRRLPAPVRPRSTSARAATRRATSPSATST